MYVHVQKCITLLYENVRLISAIVQSSYHKQISSKVLAKNFTPLFHTRWRSSIERQIDIYSIN